MKKSSSITLLIVSAAACLLLPFVSCNSNAVSISAAAGGVEEASGSVKGSSSDSRPVIAGSRPTFNAVKLDAGCHRPFPAFLWGSSSSNGSGRKLLEVVGMNKAGAGGCGGGGMSESGVKNMLSQPRDGQQVVDMLMEMGHQKAGQEIMEVIVLLLSQGEGYSTSSFSNAAAAAKNQAAHPPTEHMLEGRMRHGTGMMHCQGADVTLPYVYPAAMRPSEHMEEAARHAGYPYREGSLDDIQKLLEESQEEVEGSGGSGGSNARPGVLNNGKTDVLVARLPEGMPVVEADKLVQAFQRSLQAGQYAMAWTGDYGQAGCGHRLLREESMTRRRLAATTRTIKATPDILAGVLFLFMFIFVVVLGLTCMGGISYPRAFKHTGPPLGKEY